MSKRSSELLIDDMLEAIQKIEEFTSGYSKEQFLNDSKTVDAVVRNLEIIGEAATRMPETIRAGFVDIEWAKIVGLRHRVVHEYFGIDLEIIWSILKNDLPPFKTALGKKVKG